MAALKVNNCRIYVKRWLGPGHWRRRALGICSTGVDEGVLGATNGGTSLYQIREYVRDKSLLNCSVTVNKRALQLLSPTTPDFSQTYLPDITNIVSEICFALPFLLFSFPPFSLFRYFLVTAVPFIS